MTKENTDFHKWIDKAFFALMTFVAMYATNQVKELTVTVNDLSIKLSVYISRSELRDVQVTDHESRIRKLEGI